MKALVFLVSFLFALLAWAAAVVDYALAKVSLVQRPYLVPGRTFYAAFRVCGAYLRRQPIDRHSFRLRDYPHHRWF